MDWVDPGRHEYGWHGLRYSAARALPTAAPYTGSGLPQPMPPNSVHFPITRTWNSLNSLCRVRRVGTESPSLPGGTTNAQGRLRVHRDNPLRKFTGPANGAGKFGFLRPRWYAISQAVSKAAAFPPLPPGEVAATQRVRASVELPSPVDGPGRSGDSVSPKPSRLPAQASTASTNVRPHPPQAATSPGGRGGNAAVRAGPRPRDRLNPHPAALANDAVAWLVPPLKTPIPNFRAAGRADTVTLSAVVQLVPFVP